jgi:hypothetical protein
MPSFGGNTRAGASLGSGFSADAPISPATVTGTNAVLSPVSRAATSAASAAALGDDPPASPIRQGVLRRSAADGPVTSTGAQATAHARTAAPSVPAVAQAPIFGAADSGTVLRRSFAMAPPRISVRPGAPATDLASNAAAAPESAPAETKSAADIRRHVAQLFQTFNDAEAAGTMDAQQHGQQGRRSMDDAVIRRAGESAPAFAPFDANVRDSRGGQRLERPATQFNREQMDEIVDGVVARIEQRVIDELERRGRRADPGVF